MILENNRSEKWSSWVYLIFIQWGKKLSSKQTSSQFSAYENQNYHGRMPTNGLSFGTKKVDLSLNTTSLEAIFMKNQAL